MCEGFYIPRMRVEIYFYIYTSIYSVCVKRHTSHTFTQLQNQKFRKP